MPSCVQQAPERASILLAGPGGSEARQGTSDSSWTSQILRRGLSTKHISNKSVVLQVARHLVCLVDTLPACDQKLPHREGVRISSVLMWKLMGQAKESGRKSYVLG